MSCKSDWPIQLAGGGRPCGENILQKDVVGKRSLNTKRTSERTRMGTVFE